MNITELINNAKSIAIISHINMDGDAIGSSLGLMFALKKIGKKVITYIEEEIPHRFDLWKDTKDLVYYNDKTDVTQHDLLIVVDVADKNLLGNRAKLLDEIPNNLAIDHHALHVKYSENSYVDKEAAATGEIIYNLIKKMDIPLDIEIANCLYVAISTDTGRFKFNNTTKRTHEIAGHLITYGVKTAELSNKLFDERSKEGTMLIAKSIETLELFDDCRIAVMTITRDIMNEVRAKDSDQDGVIDFVTNISGVEVGILIKEKENGALRASLRSKTYVDVSKIASLFNGGGHKMAAGCGYDGDIDEFKLKLVENTRRELK